MKSRPETFSLTSFLKRPSENAVHSTSPPMLVTDVLPMRTWLDAVELAAKLEAQEQKVAAQQHKIDSLINQLSSTSEGKRLNEDNGAVLLQNAPNPFTSETQIKMTLPDDVRYASLMIYNLSGKQIKTVLVNDRGEVSVKISGNELSAGMYLYSLIADGKVVDTKRLILTQ